jgi:hypothetical protein
VGTRSSTPAEHPTRSLNHSPVIGLNSAERSPGAGAGKAEGASWPELWHSDRNSNPKSSSACGCQVAHERVP